MSDASPATATGAPTSAQPPQAPQAAGDEDPAKKRRLNNAVTFLRNAQVRASPLARRVNFLASKGLSADEIVTAFQRVGQPQSLQSIQDIISGKTAATTAAPAAPAAAPAAAVATSAAAPAPALPPNPPHGTVQYVYAHAPPPQQQAPAPKKEEGLSWKDYFIGATVASVGAVGAVKAFTAFSPWDIVRKDQMPPPAPQLPAAPMPPMYAASQQQQSMPMGYDPRAQQQPVQTPLVQQQGPASFNPAPAPLQRSASASAAPEVAVPTVAPAGSVAEGGATAEDVAKLKEELEASQAAHKEAKEALDKVRREKADMAVNVGKLKGQVATLQRTIERTQREQDAAVKDRVAEELKKRDEAAAAGATGSTAATPGADVSGAATPAVAGGDSAAATPVKQTAEEPPAEAPAVPAAAAATEETRPEPEA